jgi:SsrA-binding protein
MARSDKEAVRVAAQNRRARHDYAIEDSLEVGIVLTGSEVKSLRAGRATITEAYASEEGGQLYLINAYIPEYTQAGERNHETRRPRKLLAHRRQIGRLAGAVQREGMTLVPLKLYFNDRGIAKLELGVARGKKQYEKRDATKKREWERDKARIMRSRG